MGNNVIVLKDKIAQKKQNPKKFYLLIIPLALIILLTSIYGVFQYFQPVSTVILDSPRRIYINVNKYNKVIKIKPLRQSSNTVVNDTDLFNWEINDALKEIITYYESSKIIDESYFPYKKPITIYLTSDKKIYLDITEFKDFMNTKKLKLIINQNGSDYK
ncbi:hypothetical protein SH2C18_11670 [Clostridium sediminicola]|uniref:anti-sigma-I factor RsgI family protein n=1 Tax=Clostridium sediminicola TaxID=3114879 RepID=UPI0031F208C1